MVNLGGYLPITPLFQLKRLLRIDFKAVKQIEFI